MAISQLARQYIIEDLISIDCIPGQMSRSEFVRRVYPKVTDMPSKDRRFKTAVDDIWQHMDNNRDWSFEDLFFNYLDLLNVDEEDFIYFLEQYVHPSIRRFDWDEENLEKVPFDNSRCVDVINKYLVGEGYELKATDQFTDLPIYSVLPLTPGVKGNIKNIIFSSKYKPEIVFDDALNNDIRIIRNADKCLIYDRPIPDSGVKWSELVSWYAEQECINEDQEIEFCKRLVQSMDSEPEKIMLRAYYCFLHDNDIDGPALIPQVYLYYDPQTIKQRGYKLFEHQIMDFLMIFSHRDRVVIEIDGKQHYAEGDKASPELYADMVKAHREMSLYGYDVYRFGGFEFMENKNELIEELKAFFSRLFKKYGIEVD